MESLEELPKRTQLAEENQCRTYEVRQLTVGSQLLLLSIDEKQRKVWVIGLRGAAHRPRRKDLPSTLDKL